MSKIKEAMTEEEARRIRKLEGYRKELSMDSTDEMDCPYCLNALSCFDYKEVQCLHCGYQFSWNLDK